MGLGVPLEAQLYFDVASGNGLGTATGSYNWDTTTNLWNTASSGSGSQIKWTNGSASVFNAGSGTYTLNVVSAITGANLTVQQGNVTIAHGTGGSYQLSANSTFNVASSLTFSENIGQNASGRTLTKTGAGALTLSGNNTFSGTFTLNGGTVNINSGTALGSGGFTYTSGTIDNTSGGAVTINNAVTLNTNLTFAGTNDLTLGGNLSLGNSNRTFTINGSTLAVSGVVSQSGGARGVTKNGSGTLALNNAANTYSGVTTINAGTLSVSKLANGGSNSSIGTSSNAATSLVINGGTLRYTGGGDSTNRLFTLGTSGGTLDASGTGAVNFTATGAVTLSGTNTARTLTLTGTNTATNTLGLSIGNNGSGATAVTKDGSGTWALTNTASSYTGVTTINAGTLVVSKLANGGNNSSIGAANNGATFLVINGGTLRYTGSGDTTNRLFTLGANGATIDSSGSGALTFSNTGSLSATGSGNRTLTLTGSYTGGANTLASVITNPGSGTTSLVKDGAGTWTLTATNTFSGNVSVVNGTLGATAAGSLGTGALSLDGGTLRLANNSATNFGRNTTVTVNSTVVADRATSSTTGVTHTLGTLSIGDQTLSISRGSNITGSGVGGITFGATTLTGNSAFSTGANSLLTLGALNDGGVARTLTFTGSGTTALGSSATSLVSGTAINVTGGTLNSNNANALGSNANVTVSSGATFGVGASQTVAGLNGVAGSTVSLGSNALTINSSSGINGTFAGTINGTGGSIVKSGSDSLTLSGSNGYTGGTTLNAGTLFAGSNTAFGTGTLTINGGILAASGGARTLSNNVVLGGNFTVGGSDNLTFGGSTFNLGGDRTITVDNSATTTISASITQPYYSSLTKQGAGRLVLSGSNSFQGAVNVQQGTLAVQNSGALGVTGTWGNIVADGATLELSNNVAINEGGFTISGTGDGGVGAIRNFSDNNSIAGQVVLGGDATVNASAGSLTFSTYSDLGSNTLTVTGAGNTAFTAQVGGSGSIVKSGAGTLTLSGSNSYSGTTSVNGGILSVNNLTGGGASSSIGNSNGSVASNLVLNGGTLSYTGGSISTDRLFSVGTSGGTIDSSGSGALTLNNTGAMGFNGQSGARTLTLTGSTDASLAAAIGDNGGGTSIVKNGTNTWTLNGSASNTHTGTTTVNAGTLALAKTGGATAIAGNLVIGDGSGTDTVRLDAANQIASTATVTFTSGGTPTLNLNGYTQTLGSISSSNTGAVIAFGSPGSTTDFKVGNSSNSTYAGTFTSGNANGRLVKQGTGTLTLSGASSSFTGGVQVNEGILKVQNADALGSGTAGTTVASGATLQLDGGVLGTFNGTLTLSGNGYNNLGALYGTGGNNRWGNNIALAGDTTVSTDSTGYLALGLTTTRYNRALEDPTGTPADPTILDLGNHTLTLTGTTSAADNRAIYINGRLQGTGNLVVNMTNTADTVRLTNNYNPDFTGTTTIKNGTLSLAGLYNTFPDDPEHPNFFLINGPVVIGDGVGAANSALLTIQANGAAIYDEQMSYNTPITLYKDGQFSLLAAQTIGTLTFNGGNIDLGTTGTLFLNGDVTVNASAGNTATITGTDASGLSLTIHQGPNPVPNAARVFDVVGGAGNTSDLTISARIYNGSIVKNGIGTMTITGDNSAGYEGTTTVNNGILAITNGKALGQSDGTDDTASIVNSGGTLQLSNNITVTNEKLTLNGTGYNDQGALQNLSGNNTWAGEVVVNDARSKSEAGLLTLSGTVTINTALEVTGSGDTTISGPVGGAGGAITKNGTGTLIISGDNTYGGLTTINQGVLSLQSNKGLGSTASGSGTRVTGNGAALELSNATYGGSLSTDAEPLFLNGTGVSGNGALRNAAGNNTFGGAITLESDSLITANSGTTLTMSGGILSSGKAVTFGTTANNGNLTVSGTLATGTAWSNAGSLTKNGSGSLTISGSGTNIVGATHLNAGTMTVASGKTLQTGAFDSAASTTLIIGSGGTVVSNYASGTTVFSGTIDAATGGTFQKDGAGILVFDHSFDAGAGSTLVLNGGTLKLGDAAQITFGTIHITADTVLDFSGLAGTVLSSTNLIIDAGVSVRVDNWFSVANEAAQSTVWYATQTVNLNGSSSTLGGSDEVGTTPLNNVTFTNYDGLTTTWVSGDHNGWFDHEIRPTPEPATYGALFIGAALAVVGVYRFRQRKAAPPQE